MSPAAPQGARAPRGISRIPASAVAFAIERPEPEVTAGDRFSFAAFLALALHAAVILGVGFALPDPPEPMRSLEVTLAQFRSDIAPEDPDFLAQADQTGSGTLTEVQELTTDREAPMIDTRIAEALQPQPETGVREPRPDPRLDADRADADVVSESDREQTPAPDDFDTASVLAQALDMASLNARRSNEIQLDARGRRVRRLTSVSARTAVEAAYLDSWRNKIERIGNLNYPMEARQRGLEGDLRVLVEIDASGRLLEVRILDSSGSEVLDASALRIVRLAAPYLPFPAELSAETDILQIVRTWQFRRRGFGSG